MRRREFLATAIGTAGLAGTGLTSSQHAQAAHHKSGHGKTAAHNGDRQYYELRRYRLTSEADRELNLAHWREAAQPAYNRLGVTPVGVFEPTDDSDDAGQLLYVLLTYQSPEHLMQVRQQLAQDKQYQKAAEDYLSTSKDDPAYSRIESKLMVAFDGQPQLHRPSLTRQNKDRLLELRTYESHNERKGQLKVEMFNKHEITLFQNLGFPHAVFHGDTIIGDKLPNLTYMLCFENRAQRDRLWKKFIDSEGWAKLSSMPRYENTVSKVHNWFLKPTDFSQV